MTTRSFIDLGETSFSAAHPAIEPNGLVRLADSKAVLARYRQGGPHATVVMPVAVPGRPGHDMDKQWSAIRTDLEHLGADETALAHLDSVVAALPQSGHDVLVTANPAGAAYCWLLHSTGVTLMRVGDAPSLVPALIEVDRRPRVVAAAVDRVGADLALVDHAHIDTQRSVDGDKAGLHDAAGRESDRGRHRRHADVVVERNAGDIAKEISRLVARHRAPVVVLTGDRRVIDLVATRVATPTVTVYAAHAGGRHERDTPQRLLAAAIHVATEQQRTAWDADRDRLDEELGQQDLAVDGDVHTLQAITDQRVAKLFVDADSWTEREHVDELIRAAHSNGAAVCATSAAELTDGVGALLRTPYHSTVTT